VEVLDGPIHRLHQLGDGLGHYNNLSYPFFLSSISGIPNMKIVPLDDVSQIP
jgi:hypothetical protein